MNWLDAFLPVLLGVGTKYLFAGAKKTVKVLDKAPAPVQQIGVLGVAAGVTWATQWVPGLDQIVSLADPTLAAGIAAGNGVRGPSAPGPRDR